MELANLREDGVKRFQKRFDELLPRSNYVGVVVITGSAFDNKQTSRKVTEEEIRHTEEFRILKLRNFIRKIWIEPDLRTKRYGVFLLWKFAIYPANWVEEDIPSSLPPPSPFEQIIQVLIDDGGLTRYCGNSECLTPYFIASRRNQKYCSDACVVQAQREFKRQWWSEKGDEWRARRLGKQSSKKSSKKGKV